MKESMCLILFLCSSPSTCLSDVYQPFLNKKTLLSLPCNSPALSTVALFSFYAFLSSSFVDVTQFLRLFVYLWRKQRTACFLCVSVFAVAPNRIHKKCNLKNSIHPHSSWWHVSLMGAGRATVAGVSLPIEGMWLNWQSDFTMVYWEENVAIVTSTNSTC